MIQCQSRALQRSSLTTFFFVQPGKTHPYRFSQRRSYPQPILFRCQQPRQPPYWQPLGGNCLLHTELDCSDIRSWGLPTPPHVVNGPPRHDATIREALPLPPPPLPLSLHSDRLSVPEQCDECGRGRESQRAPARERGRGVAQRALL